MKNFNFFRKVFNRTNFIRITIIFIVGFITRAFINYTFDVNINYGFIDTILSSFMISSIFILIISEYIYSEIITSFLTKSIYPIFEYSILYMKLKYENIKSYILGKIIYSYYNTTTSKINVIDFSYKLNTMYNTERFFNTGDLWEERRRKAAETKLPSFRSLNLPPSVYKNEWELANDNRGKDNWDECKFKSTFISKCNNDFQNFIDKNKNSIKCSDNKLIKNRDWFTNSLYEGHTLDYALKSLPIGMRDSYKQYLFNLEKTRKV